MTHPIGYFGPAPGASIGVWNRQGGVPGKGEYRLSDSTCYALELCIVEEISEWDDQKETINLEETVIFREGSVEFPDGRQTEFHLID